MEIPLLVQNLIFSSTRQVVGTNLNKNCRLKSQDRSCMCSIILCVPELRDNILPRSHPKVTLHIEKLKKA